MAAKRTNFEAVVITVTPGGGYTVHAVKGMGENMQTAPAYPRPDENKGIKKHNRKERVNIAKEKNVTNPLCFFSFETHGSPGYINLTLPNGNLIQIPIPGC